MSSIAVQVQGYPGLIKRRGPKPAHSTQSTLLTYLPQVAEGILGGQLASSRHCGRDPWRCGRAFAGRLLGEVISTLHVRPVAVVLAQASK
jgi:hypothetical protein